MDCRLGGKRAGSRTSLKVASLDATRDNAELSRLHRSALPLPLSSLNPRANRRSSAYTFHMAPILYLDYDGILHPADVRVTKAEPLCPKVYERGQPTEHPLFEHAPLLARLLEPFPDVRVSLSTSWVRALGYGLAVQQLPLALQARVVGTIRQGWLLQYPPPYRHDAITTDAEERKVGRWLALDDDIEGWPAERRHLVVAPTNAWQGLAQPGISDELTAALELLCSGGSLESRLPGESNVPSTMERLFGRS